MSGGGRAGTGDPRADTDRTAPDAGQAGRAAPDAGQAGLTTAQVDSIRTALGRNEVTTEPPPRVPLRVARQFADPLVALLLAAAVITALLRDAADTAVILLVVIVNTAIGVSQEIRADRAIAALHRLAAPTARVIRDGREHEVPAVDLVPGDRVLLAAGDVVPADVTLDRAWRLRLDESALTGESAPVTRDAGDEAPAGVVVVAGRGGGTVTRTGSASALGRIASLVTTARPDPTPLQRRLSRLSRTLGVAVVAVSAVVMLLGLLAGRPVLQMGITAVSLVVAAVPESLPAVVTLSLALGARRMARGHAIARRLHAVETLGSVTVVASDKTGTLTEGRMSVVRAVLPDGRAWLPAGSGYDPAGAVHPADPATPPLSGEPATAPGAPGEAPGAPGSPGAPPGALADLARACVLCNDARLVAPEPGGQWAAIGDPLEGALLAFAARCGVDAAAANAAAPRTGEQPFDAATRRMVTWHRTDGADGRATGLVVCKGAPEVVLTPEVLDADVTDLDAARRSAAELTGAGLRVLAVATGAGDRYVPDSPVTGLRLAGLVGVVDPLRAAAPAVAEAFAAAGIRLVMITGDHPATAARIAARLGIWRTGDPVVRGDTDQVAAAARTARVFARIRPEQKLDIIAGLRAGGAVVAMTGDGVNDAPALRRADIGVAMGRGGTEVARQASDLVLTDDNLATVAVAVAEGRRIYANIRRFLRYALSGGTAELVVMLVGPFFGLAVPLLPAQILWVNLLTHGLPGVALGAEPADRDVTRTPPRSPQESVLGGGLATGILVIGALISVTVLGAAVAAYHTGRPWQSIGFVVLGLSQLGVALAVRVPRRRRFVPRGARATGNPALWAAVALSAFLQVIAVYWSPLRGLLGTEPVAVTDLLGCAAVAAIPGLLTAFVLFRGGLRTGPKSPPAGPVDPDTPAATLSTLESDEEVVK